LLFENLGFHQTAFATPISRSVQQHYHLREEPAFLAYAPTRSLSPSSPSCHTHEMASSLFSPHEKQCPNWESANSCSPPAAATLKYPQPFLLLRKFSSCTVPELGLKP